MPKEFICNHCGKCCTELTTPINLTLGDILRISKKINKPIKELFQEVIDFNPFQIEEGIYEFEPGLNKPCKFHKDERCLIYNVRPLNCRIFPFWLLKAPDEAIDKTYGCLPSIIELKKDPNKKYLEYGKKISKIIMEESELTEKLLAEISGKKIIDIKNHPYYKHIEKQDIDIREKESEKIKLCIKLKDSAFFKNIPEKIEKKITKELLQKLDNSKELEKIEKILK